jgi:methylamine---glutamate N-methyltransferase subunit B
MQQIDLEARDIRALNQQLQRRDGNQLTHFEVANPRGQHCIAAGCMHDIDVQVRGHAGYYCGGMNQLASITIHGNTGVGVAENMMSGTVRVAGDASQSAGATAHGGLLVIEGNASARCAISLKGADIVVGGSVGHNSAFMAQAGRLVVCGDAEDGLGDSIYEAVIYVRGLVAGLGADCIEKDMSEAHIQALSALLLDAGISADAHAFRRYGSARALYNFNVDNSGQY